MSLKSRTGFTLVELVVVIVILGILASVALPRFVNISSDAKISALNNIAGQVRTTNKLIQYKATIAGLKRATSNPGGSSQADYVVDFGFGETEVDWRNLCGEARAEVGDDLLFFEFMNIDSDQLEIEHNNRYASIGYAIPGAGAPTNQGCYLYYDSFDIDCSVTVVTESC